MVATGSDPVLPPIPGLAELGDVWTNREATGLTELPRRLLVMGGGPVGVELSQAFHRMGADVALIEGADRLLAREPEPLGAALGAALGADGVELHLGQFASSVGRDGYEFVVEFPTAAAHRGATARRHRADAAQRRARTGQRRGRARQARRSRSTRGCPRGTGCGRSATWPGSGR